MDHAPNYSFPGDDAVRITIYSELEPNFADRYKRMAVATQAL